MPVKRRKAKVRITGFPDWQVRFMESGIPPADSPDPNPFEVLTWTCHRAEHDDPVKSAWDKCRDKIMPAWTARHPGTRPYSWWEYDAPRESIGTRPGTTHWDGKLAEPRERLNGTGTPAHEVLAYGPSYFMGIPTSWVQQSQVERYNGRSRDIHGNRIEKWKGGYYKEGDFKGVAIDPDAPPTFESQAAYLERHKLLTDDERDALPGNAFEPVRYVPDEF